MIKISFWWKFGYIYHKLFIHVPIRKKNLPGHCRRQFALETARLEKKYSIPVYLFVGILSYVFTVRLCQKLLQRQHVESLSLLVLLGVDGDGRQGRSWNGKSCCSSCCPDYCFPLYLLPFSFVLSLAWTSVSTAEVSQNKNRGLARSSCLIV